MQEHSCLCKHHFEMSSTPTNMMKEERQDEAEIRELAAKLAEAYKTKVAQNLGDRRVTQTASPSSSGTSFGDDEKATDEESIRGRFGWVQLGKCLIPYIFRTGEKYCSVRMVEMKLLNKYLNYLHQDIYSCTCIHSYYITETESRLLNEINITHCNKQFGGDLFTTRDLIVRLSDTNEFYNFLDVCYSKLTQGSCNAKNRCGFIRVNKDSVVSYTVKNDNKYVPLFYFDGETENMNIKVDQLEGWDLSYLKFCCKVQGIRNELFAHDSCAVISLNVVKSYFPPGTVFEDYWPSKVVDSLLLNGRNSTQVGQWMRPPPTPPVVPKGQTNLASQQPTVSQQPVPVIYGSYAGLASGQLTFQTISGQVVRVGQAGTRATYQMPAPALPSSSRPLPPPLLVRTAVPPSTGASSTHTSPSITPVTQGAMMIQDINGIGQPVNTYQSATRSNVSLSQRYPPPLIPMRNVNGAQRFHTYPNSTSAAHRNSANGRQTVELGKKLIQIAETPTLGTHVPYKMQKVLVDKKMIPCINMKPYMRTALLVTLPDLVNYFFHSVQLSSCRRVMDVFRIKLYRGNSQQMQVLMDAGKCQNVNDNLPLVQVHDVIKFMPQIKYMMSSLLSEPVTKRQRTS